MQERTVISKEQFDGVDIELPIRGSKHIDCNAIADLYRNASNHEQDINSKNVYSFLMSVCDIYLNPITNNDPYVEKISTPQWRSMRPEDIIGEQSLVLSQIAASIQNAGLRARLADLVWHNDRSRADMAKCAIDAYVDGLRDVLDGKSKLFGDELGVVDHDGLNMLYRACQISYGIGGKQEHLSKLKSLAWGVIARAIENDHYGTFMSACDLALEFNLGNATDVAAKLESVVDSGPTDGHVRRDLWQLAAKGHRLSKCDSEVSRCLTEAAECYVQLADAAKGDGILEPSFLMDAISSMMSIPNTRQRRTELQSRLDKVKGNIPDQMGTYSTQVDLSDVVKEAKDKVGNVSLACAIRNFVLLYGTPSPDELRKQARDAAEKYPISNMMPVAMYDDEGNVVAKSSGYSGKDDEGLRRIVHTYEQFRRQTQAYGGIDPARVQISFEHSIGEASLSHIVHRSPFIPVEKTGIFLSGFTNFFLGDYISASHILIPQLENSLRYILKQHGQDTSKIKQDATQERIILSTILKNEKLEEILTPSIVYEIDNLFNHRFGPSLRHQFAHGLVSSSACFSPDVIYACWFILRLACLPLIHHWDEIAEAMDAA